MGRTWAPDGKRRSIGLKVSDAKFAAIEAERGDVSRALWLEGLIDAALGWDGSQVAVAAVRAPAVRTGPSRAVSAPARAEAVVAAEATCRHPSGSVKDSVCQECGQDVWLR